MECGGDVELGRGVRHLRNLPSAGHGRLLAMPDREKAGRLRRGLGRLQPLVPQLLHVPVGEAEQPLPPLSTGMGRAANRQMNQRNIIAFLFSSSHQLSARSPARVSCIRLIN